MLSRFTTGLPELSASPAGASELSVSLSLALTATAAASSHKNRRASIRESMKKC